jgi:hypothetical protein
MKAMFPAARRSLGDLNGWTPGTDLQNLGDGRLDFDDIPFFVRVLRANQVNATSASLLAAVQAVLNGVPEPSSILLLCSGIVMMMNGLGRHPRCIGL